MGMFPSQGTCRCQISHQVIPHYFHMMTTYTPKIEKKRKKEKKRKRKEKKRKREKKKGKGKFVKTYGFTVTCNLLVTLQLC